MGTHQHNMRVYYTYSFSQVRGKIRTKHAYLLTGPLLSHKSLPADWSVWRRGWGCHLGNQIRWFTNHKNKPARSDGRIYRRLCQQIVGGCQMRIFFLAFGFMQISPESADSARGGLHPSTHRSVHLSGRPSYNFEHDLPPNGNAKGNYGPGPTKWFGQPKTTKPNHSHYRCPASNPSPFSYTNTNTNTPLPPTHRVQISTQGSCEGKVYNELGQEGPSLGKWRGVRHVCLCVSIVWLEI